MSANIVFIKSGAQSPVIPGEFVDGDGNAIDLTGKSVAWTMRPWNSTSYIVDHQPASINGDPALGNAYYALSAEEAVAGHHLGEWSVNPGNLILPVDGYVHVLIAPAL